MREADGALGSAFVSLVEPHDGHERRYNRWYEDDHVNSAGAMALPWWFAGRRWVAPRALRELRAPATSPIADPVTAGCYLATYWITAGRWEDQWALLGPAVAGLRKEGRMFDERTHVHTAFYDHRASVRDGPGPVTAHALGHAYQGLVLEVVDGEGEQLERWLVGEYLPARLAETNADLCAVFAPRPWPEGQLWFDAAPAPAGRRMVLWFLHGRPQDDWAATFAAEPELLAAAGHGRVALLAPFVPTVPGTDRYVDELR